MALGQQLDTQIHIVKEQLEGEVISYLHQLASAESLLAEGENSTLLGVKYKPREEFLIKVYRCLSVKVLNTLRSNLVAR